MAIYLLPIEFGNYSRIFVPIRKKIVVIIE